MMDPPSHARRRTGCRTGWGSSALHRPVLSSSQDERTRGPYRPRASGRDLGLRLGGEGLAVGDLRPRRAHDGRPGLPLGRGPVVSDLTPAAPPLIRGGASAREGVRRLQRRSALQVGPPRYPLGLPRSYDLETHLFSRTNYRREERQPTSVCTPAITSCSGWRRAGPSRSGGPALRP